MIQNTIVVTRKSNHSTRGRREIAQVHAYSNPGQFVQNVAWGYVVLINAIATPRQLSIKRKVAIAMSFPASSGDREVQLGTWRWMQEIRMLDRKWKFAREPTRLLIIRWEAILPWNASVARHWWKRWNQINPFVLIRLSLNFTTDFIFRFYI